MTRALAMTLLLAAACGDSILFNTDFPDDIPCSDTNSCPPHETCVPGEHMCRFVCNSDGSCPHAINSSVLCDSDHYCRPGCGSGMSPPAACATGNAPNCPSGQICDTAGTKQICRPICSGVPNAAACSTGFSCATLPGTSCGGCRPGG
jgi:hypothetical protein